MILIAEGVVDLDQAGVVESGSADVSDVVDCGTGVRGVGSGPELKQRLGDGVSYLRTFGSGWHARRTHSRIDLAEAFPRGKEESFVPAYGAAECRAILIAVEGILDAAQFVGEEVRGIEIGIAEVFEGRP